MWDLNTNLAFLKLTSLSLLGCYRLLGIGFAHSVGKRNGIVSTYETGESSTSRSSHKQSRRHRLLNGLSTTSTFIFARDYNDKIRCSFLHSYVFLFDFYDINMLLFLLIHTCFVESPHLIFF